jgi:hypothetical protein
MFNYLNKNKHWIFSGIGVPLLYAIINAFPNLVKIPNISSPNTIITCYSQNNINTQDNNNTIETKLLERIRITNNVRKLDAINNDLSITKIPLGTYGYSGIISIDHLKNLTVNCTEDTYNFEFHKKYDGTYEIIGFISKDTEAQLQRTDRQNGYKLTLYNHLWSNAQSITSIPISLIDLNSLATFAIAMRTIPRSRTIHIENKNIEAFDISLR